MSASPAGPSPSVSDGKTPPVGLGNVRRMKARPAADPLRMGAKRKPIPKPNTAPKAVTRPNGNGLQAIQPSSSALHTPSSFAIPKNQGPGPELQLGPAVTQTTFTDTPSGQYNDFPLITTKRALREGLRYHIARFASKKKVDVTNQDEFVRPVSLHRRDPNALPVGKEDKLEPEDVMDDKEREKLEIAKEEKARQRAADLALIAPSGNNAAAMAQKRNQAFRNEKSTQIFRIDKTEADRKRSELRYEEALPWHLEDAEAKQTWVGSYESALSDTNVILVPEHGVFKMIPVEKWYKFTAKNHFKSMTIEEAEEQMKKKSKPTRWAMHDEEKSLGKRELQETRRLMGSVYGIKKESASFKNSGKRELEDADDLDFDAEGLFQDDDEQVTVEPVDDEDSKNTQDKIKKEQMGANLFGDADEQEIEKELQREEAEEKLRKVGGKGIKKALKKREKNHLHESDSEDNDPFNESGNSSDDTTDDEKMAEDDRRKDEEAKAKAKAAGLKVPTNAGLSSKSGTDTPTSKGLDPLRNHKKRVGSPGLSASEASGNESARKKHKKKHAGPSAAQSDNDSDASRSLKKKSGKSSNAMKKMRNSANGALSPNGSRAGSPMAGGTPMGSRGASPALGLSAASATSALTPERVIAAIPASGITIGELNKLFPETGKHKDVRAHFIRLVKVVADYDTLTKLLTVKAK